MTDTTDQKSILIIGGGGIGERHLRCFQNTGRTRVSLCESNEQRLGELVSKYHCEGYLDLNCALEAAHFAGVVICTPANTHLSIAEKCVRAGSHALIEKPLSTSLDGFDSLLAATRETGRAVRVAYVYRSIPMVVEARRLVQSGQFGRICHVVALYGQNYPSTRPDFQRIYYARRASGGGAIQDALTHIVHAVEWTVGAVSEVACMAARQVLQGVEAEDTVNLICRHSGGALSSLTTNQFQAPNETMISYHGEQGSVRVDFVRQRVGTLRQGETEWQWKEVPHGERDVMFVAQAEAFLEAMEGRPEELSTLEDAAQTLRVNLAALRSFDEGQFVRI